MKKVPRRIPKNSGGGGQGEIEKTKQKQIFFLDGFPYLHIVLPRSSEVVLEMTRLSLAVVDRVDKPEVVDDCVLEEGVGVVEDNVDLGLLDRGYDTWASGHIKQPQRSCQGASRSNKGAIKELSRSIKDL